MHARGIGDTRAAEFVYAPTVHYVLLCIDKVLELRNLRIRVFATLLCECIDR